MADSSSKTASKPVLHKTYVRTPTIYQMEASECGAASLAMVLGYFGCFVPLEKLRIETGVSRDGVNAKNMLAAARKYGLTCKGYTKTLEDTLAMKTPVIVHWNFNHFVVFEGIKQGHAYINDPAYGRRRLTIDEFDEGFTGVVLTFEKGENFRHSRRPVTLPQFVARRAFEEYASIKWLFFTGLILTIPGIILPLLSEVFVDDILGEGRTNWVSWLLVMMMGTMLFQLVFTWIKSGVLMFLQAKVLLKSSYKFLSRLLRLPIAFYDQRMAGDLVQRVDNNNNIATFITGQLADVGLSLILSVFYLIIMLFYSVPLTLIGVINVAVGSVLSLVTSKVLSNFNLKSEQDSSKLTGSFYSGMSITSTLKASGAEKEYTARMLGYYAKCAGNDQKIGRYQQLLGTIPGVLQQIVSILILMKGGEYVMHGALSTGMLLAFNQMLSGFTDPVNKIVGFFQQFQTLRADIARVDDIEKYELARQFEEDDLNKRRALLPHEVIQERAQDVALKFAKEVNKRSDDIIRLRSKITGRRSLIVTLADRMLQYHDVDKAIPDDKKLMGEVETRDVSFGYSLLNEPLIEDFNFKAYPGMRIAFVGASGCGKSTIAKLLVGLYDPWEGEILLDGIPIRDISPQAMNASVAMVNQDITIFSGTIRENITLWNPHILENDIINAAKDACIHDTITKFPGAYNYRLTEGGGNLSGGQKQRMEIARALVLNPSILILDEATSALDAIVEKQVVDNIRRRGCTCIVVAHRLSTIRDCDLIMLMENGHVVQQGTHESMKDVDGPYRRLIDNG
jgi:ABC-type bacteriocin/lantibiotic exporter with double-glycine peptidase domain